MKKLLLIIALPLFIGCKSQQMDVPNISTAKLTETKCPDKGTCKVRLEKDQHIVVKRQDWGSIFYELAPQIGTNVIVYEYDRGNEKELPDSGYREEIVFELDAKISNQNLTGASLKNLNGLFGRFCFCRGQTGYYPITDGTLKSSEKNGILNVNLDFTITEVPQIIDHINFDLK